jgi:hypothetical protein
MLSIYLFCLILGGGFLAVSLFGDAFDTDIGDVDLDIDADIDLDGHVDAGGLFKLFSIRSIIYAVFGLGAVGTSLHLIRGGEQPIDTAIYAGIGAFLSGLLISVLFGFVRRSEAGARVSDEAFTGLIGDVSIPIRLETGGLITVTQGERTVRLPAKVHSSGDGPSPEDWTKVLVIEMDAGVALVAPAGPGLLTGPDAQD